MIVREALAQATALLRTAGVETPWLDSELLLARSMGMDRVGLYQEPGRVLTAGEYDTFQQALSRRWAREPLAYIVGQREFWAMDMAVTPDVLVPRPETELLVEEALNAVGRGAREVMILDLCTGSGCVAVALAVALPQARVVATDLSGIALDVARGNASRHGVEDRMAFHQGELWEPVEDLAGRLDLITVNPPYIPTPQLRTLPPEVAGYEPSLALDGGWDGLALIRRILAEAGRFLRPGGILLMEVGVEQFQRTASIPHCGVLSAARDLSGVQRVVRLKRDPCLPAGRC